MIKNKYNAYRRLRIAAYEAFPALRSCKNALAHLKLRRFRKRLEIRRKVMEEAVSQTGRHPLFDMVEVETINRCNGECGFCPVNRNVDIRPFHKMTDSLFESLMRQLHDLDYRGVLHLYSNNEPFLDKRIAQFARTARELLPDAVIGMSTNGLILNEELYRGVIDHLSFLTVNNYCEDFKLTEKHRRIHELSMTKAEWFAKTEVVVRYQKEILDTRGSAAPNRSAALPPTLAEGCLLPTRQVVVRPDGKLSLCCNDTLGDTTLGDLNEKSLLEAWYDPAYHRLRERFLAARGFMDVCRHCDTIQGWV